MRLAMLILAMRRLVRLVLFVMLLEEMRLLAIRMLGRSSRTLDARLLRFDK